MSNVPADRVCPFTFIYFPWYTIPSFCFFPFQSQPNFHLPMAVKGDWEEMAENESDCHKKTSRVIRSYSETVINPLQRYD
jgi:hypothetical protein